MISFLFSVSGLVLLVFGCLVRFGSQLLDPFVHDVTATMGRAGSSSTLSSFNLGDYLQSATLAFIILGTFFLVLGILGCVGACCDLRICLIVYASVLGLIICAEIVFIVLLFAIRDDLETALKRPLYNSLENDFIGINSSDVISRGWNFVMIKFECCGVENYTDFDRAKRWDRTYDAGQGGHVNLMVPVACCKLTSSALDVIGTTNFTCALNATLRNANMDKGCFKAMEHFVEDNSLVLISLAVAVFVTEVLVFITAICACRTDSSRKYTDADQ